MSNIYTGPFGIGLILRSNKMARAASAILTPAQQKAADSLTTLKAELKIAAATQKTLDKAVDVAVKAAGKNATSIDKLQTKIDKLTPAKPVVAVVSHGTGAGIQAAA